MNTAFLSTTYIHRLPQRSVLLLLLAMIGWLTFSQTMPAVSPPPDGGYPGGNTAEGQDALLNLSFVTFTYNTAVGLYSLLSNTNGSFNTGVGAGTLLFNTADQNTATGAGALLNNTTGFANTANGTFALFSNTTGDENTAVGAGALLFNTIGNSNTAVGSGVLSGADGDENTATGHGALAFTTHGSFNTATGVDALVANDGDSNTAIGDQALYQNQTGTSNTAAGNAALQNNATGSSNTAIGSQAGTGVTTATNVICIGANVPGADVSDTCFIGNIYGTTTISGVTLPVIISNDGQLGTTPSSRRFKHEIRPMDKASEAILALKPVTFQYTGDKTNTPQFGLIAEEVAQVNPHLAVRDKNGEIYTVRYEAVNVMLLNEFLKVHRKVQQLEKQVEKLTADLQKVSAQIEVSKPAPQTVLNNQ